MKKKVLSLLLSAVLVVCTFPAFPALANDVWDGVSKAQPKTEAGVYQIADGKELAWFADYVNAETAKEAGIVKADAVLTQDIDLGGNAWTPISLTPYVVYAYGGTFDGQNHTVSGLNIDASSAGYGLFGTVNGAVIKNINAEGTVKSSNVVGGIVGKLQTGTVQNCSFAGSVTSTGRTTKGYTGGIAGVVNAKNAVLNGCVNTATVNGSYAGGILGYSSQFVTVENCYNSGDITGATRCAGIVGQLSKGSISSCYNIGKSKNGIYGFSNASVSNCFYLYDEEAAPGGTASGAEKITDKDTLLAKLNAGDEAAFEQDKNNLNNGYPVLAWQNNSAGNQIEKENREKVKKAVEKLTLDTSVIKAEKVLNLPSTVDECSVQWSSSDEKIIANDGRVTLPENGIANVTLTATVICDTASAQKEFSFEVWSKNIDPALYLQKVLEDLQWSFKNLQPVYNRDSNIITKFSGIIKSKGYDGVTVTLQSTEDESLISENGKITYPALDENSYANGRQVKVLFNLTVGDKTVTYPTSNENVLLIPWDTSSVEEKLNQAADELLTQETICAAGEGFDGVSSDLTLPSCLGGDKYSFAWITWETSDEKHLAISDENRKGSADALYNPYVGRVYQDNDENNVVLKATITNPSTNAVITRTFEITVAPLSLEQINHTLSAMQGIMDCYTADKLLDFATKKTLDTAAVENDIQLVIPKNIVTKAELENLDYGKYWDYWNYRFTAESSDTDVIEINSFRAYVYRPLGEDSSADKQVTITVKMQSKANPNLFVTKDIPVTVKHLSRADINNALDLMDRAKDSYSKGLLGSNSDNYSVIDNLTPYKEIVWNKDKTDVNFVYTNAEKTNNGIAVDELENWETQEDWRLFRSSNKDLISNETLLLNSTPAKDTFVKINSVLTDETLGKYYTKFDDIDGYDAEALAKFRQLYKQPVSAYVMAVGSGNYTDDFAKMPSDSKAAFYAPMLSSFKREVDKPISVSFTLLGLDGQTLISKSIENSFTKGATVFDVFKKVLGDNHIPYTAKGSYISAINNLAEFDYGSSSGWMYSVGNVFVNSYMNAQELSGGENITVMYVRDYALANTLSPTPPTEPSKPTDSTDNKTDNKTTPSDKKDAEMQDGANGNDKANQNPAAGSKGQPASDSKAEQNSPSGKADTKADSRQPSADAQAVSGEVEPSQDQASLKDKIDVEKTENNKNGINTPALVISILAALFIGLLAFIIKKKQKNQ